MPYAPTPTHPIATPPTPSPPPTPRQLLALVLVTCRLGMLAAEAAAPLKLLEKGVSKEALAGLVSRPLCRRGTGTEHRAAAWHRTRRLPRQGRDLVHAACSRHA